jgi:Zinc carboxypeptidase/Cytosolic carboxypeptidase N-terminal domain
MNIMTLLKRYIGMVLIFTSISFCQYIPETDSTGKIIEHTPLKFINTSFENASPLFWDIGPDGKIHINLIYDYERNTLNRAACHWYFQIFAEAGSDLTLVLQNFYNIWNGELDLSDATDKTVSFISEDGKNWKAIETKYIKDGHKLEFTLHMNSDSLFVARLQPYRISDLEKLKSDIADNPLIKITTIGKTYEGRPLEIIRVGHSNAPHSVFIRARAHAWEAGGNWVVQGLIKSLLDSSYKSNRYLDRYAVYIMPMANKDGVARGGTRFTVGGVNLNRHWDKPADPRYNPENACLEAWLSKMIKQGQKPDLAIDFHNDGEGNVHFSHPNINIERYKKNMARFEKLLYKYTWFTEGAKSAAFRNPGTIGEGLVERYDIDAMIYELNANWIAGLSKIPSAQDWELLGKQLRDVFYEYFEEN